MAIVWSSSLDGVDWHELEALYRAAPLGDKPAALLKTVFSNSMFRCLVYEDGKLVGAGRVLADGADCAYVCDIALLPGHQGRGLGRAIVDRLVEAARGHKKIILYAVPGREDFYRRSGFRRMRTAMAIFADPKTAAERGYIDEA
jgi:ribosomal protein S18 acetylase RimI-like enzyme